MATARYQQIAASFVRRIESGQLKAGERLPTVRSVATSFGVAPATALRALQALSGAGWVVGEIGRGTFVRTSTTRCDVIQDFRQTPRGTLDLDIGDAPHPLLGPLVADALRNIGASDRCADWMRAPPPGGHLEHRSSVARHLRNRGIRVGHEQLLLVNGIQQALAITLSRLLESGDLLVVEALSCPTMLSLARLLRLDVRTVPCDQQGPCLASLEELCKSGRVRAFFTAPTLQNPLGFVTSEQHREQLCALAAHYDFTLIEAGTFAYLADDAPRPLFCIAPERTVYISDAASSIGVGMCIAFLVASGTLLEDLKVAAWPTARDLSAIHCELLCKLIESSAVDEIEDAGRDAAIMKQRVARPLLEGLAVAADPRSEFLWLQLPDGVRGETVSLELEQQGIRVSTARPFSYTGACPQALRLNLKAASALEISGALTILRRTLGV